MNLKQQIEIKILPVVWLIGFISLMIRASSTWSAGAFNFDSLPHLLQTALFWAIGVSLGGLMEILMSVAGSRWLRLRRERRRAQFDPAYDAAERKAITEDLKTDEQIALVFTVIGFVSSMFASLAFAFRNDIAQFQTATDIAGAILLASCLFYFGVVHEPEPKDHTKAVQEDAIMAARGVLDTIGEKLRSGDYTNEDVTAIRNATPKSFQPILNALLKTTGEDARWTVTEIARWIGRDDPSGQAYVRRRMRVAMTTDHTYEIKHRTKGKGIDMPAAQAFRLFRSDFEARLISDLQTTPIGQLSSGSGLEYRADESRIGHTSNTYQTALGQAADSTVSLSVADYA
jgi:hypothetical protein